MRNASVKLEVIKGALLLAENSLDELPISEVKGKRKEKARLKEEVRLLKWVIGILEDDCDQELKGHEFLRRYYRASI